MARIAVVGAGLAGLVVARELSAQHDVTVFEKSRGTGGRMATRRAGEYEFDHGAQFFTASTADFRAFLQPLIGQGAIANWTPQFAEFERERIVAVRQWDDERPHYVGTPNMAAVGKTLASGLKLRLQTTVANIRRQNDQWSLHSAEGAPLDRFDWVIVTTPAPQATALLPENCDIRLHSESARMLGCYSLMLADPRPLTLPWQAALVRDADISWISVNSSKPGRSKGFCLLVHSTNDWADAHIDADHDWVTQHLLAETSAVLGVDARSAAHCDLHRWRYANIDLRDTPGYGLDADLQLGACGDWFYRGRVEAAFDSAMKLTGALRAVL